MSRTTLLIATLALLFAPGCAKKIVRLDEPMDPTGEDSVMLARKEAEALLKLLQSTVMHFEFDDDTLAVSDRQRLKKISVLLRERPWLAIRVAGHCDDRGTEEYNLALGQRRADATRAYLVALGVKADQIETVSFGDELPVNTEATEEGYAENRRAEMGPQPLELFGYAVTPEAK